MRLLNPIDALREGTKAVPSLKYAYGVIGIVAAAAIAVSIFESVPAAIIAAVVMLVLMALVHLFSVAAEDPAAQGPAIIFLYFCVFLFMAWSSLLSTCVFFKFPQPLPELIGSILSTPKSPVQVQSAPPVFQSSKPLLRLDDLPGSALLPLTADQASPDYEAQLASRPKVILDGSTLVIGSSSAPAAASLAFSALELRGGARIITNGSNVSLSARSITSRDGQILSFDQNDLDPPTAPPATAGVNGRTGGTLTLFGELSKDSKLTITLRGQNGGRGGSGRRGLVGAAGVPGTNAADHIFDCARGGGNGGPGRPGGDGERGAPGGNAGDGGTLWLAGPIRAQQNQISFSAPPGHPGKGGPGGDGGEGGRGGPGGAGSVFCRAGMPGPDGLSGKTGLPGENGSEGHDGGLTSK